MKLKPNNDSNSVSQKQQFGSLIKKLREERELSLTKLAEISGISHPYLSQIERGKKSVPSPKIIQKLSIPL